jgi:hypothetical protein
MLNCFFTFILYNICNMLNFFRRENFTIFSLNSSFTKHKGYMFIPRETKRGIRQVFFYVFVLYFYKKNIGQRKMGETGVNDVKLKSNIFA